MRDGPHPTVNPGNATPSGYGRQGAGFDDGDDEAIEMVRNSVRRFHVLHPYYSRVIVSGVEFPNFDVVTVSRGGGMDPETTRWDSMEAYLDAATIEEEQIVWEDKPQGVDPR